MPSALSVKRRAFANQLKKARQITRRGLINKNKLNRQVHMFKRIVNLGTYTASITSGGVPTITPVSKAFSFQLSDLPNVSEYKALYDQYKITGIKFTAVPRTSMTTQGVVTGTTAPVGYGQVVTAIDYDDAANPIAKDTLLEYGSAKFTPSSKVHSRFFRPKVLNAVWVNIASTGYSPVKAPWVDQANDNLPHYGLKMWIDPPENSSGGSNSSISYDVYATYYFMCKNTR